VLGKAAIRGYFEQTIAAFKAAGLKVEDAPIGDLRASGDLGFQWMTYRISDRFGAVVDTGKLLTLFQRKNGKWMIIGDTWNSTSQRTPQPRHS
jgi:ketosteroid isomerase-like protein